MDTENGVGKEKLQEENNLMINKEEAHYGTVGSTPDFMNIDQILDKIGYTRYHILVIIITAFTLIADGAEIYTIYLISPILRKVYNLPTPIVALLSSCLFIGFGIGSFFSGSITTLYKRRLPMLVSLFIIMLFGTICVLIENIWFFIGCRLIIGLGIGILINFVNSLCEILPSKGRDFLMGSIFIFWKVGIVYFCLICLIFMNNTLDERYWKICTVLGVLPNCVSFILIFFFYEESPRVLLWNNEMEKGFAALDKLGAYNNVTISEQEKDGIREFIKMEKDVKGSSNPCQMLKILFSSPLTLLSILVFLLWFLNSAILYMNHYSFPIILNKINFGIRNNSKKHKMILEILYTNIIPIPAELLAGALTATSFFGRKYTIGLGFFFQMIFSFIMCMESQYLFIYSSLITFFNVLSFNITKLYTCEVYHTRFRDDANGFGNAMSRIGGIMVPFIAELGFYTLKTFGPIMIICGLSLFSVIVALSLPFDTYGKPLDDINIYHNKEKEIKEIK